MWAHPVVTPPQVLKGPHNMATSFPRVSDPRESVRKKWSFYDLTEKVMWHSFPSRFIQQKRVAKSRPQWKNLFLPFERKHIREFTDVFCTQTSGFSQSEQGEKGAHEGEAGMSFQSLSRMKKTCGETDWCGELEEKWFEDGICALRGGWSGGIEFTYRGLIIWVY